MLGLSILIFAICNGIENNYIKNNIKLLTKNPEHILDVARKNNIKHFFSNNQKILLFIFSKVSADILKETLLNFNAPTYSILKGHEEELAKLIIKLPKEHLLNLLKTKGPLISNLSSIKPYIKKYIHSLSLDQIKELLHGNETNDILLFLNQDTLKTYISNQSEEVLIDILIKLSEKHKDTMTFKYFIHSLNDLPLEKLCLLFLNDNRDKVIDIFNQTDKDNYERIHLLLTNFQNLLSLDEFTCPISKTIIISGINLPITIENTTKNHQRLFDIRALQTYIDSNPETALHPMSGRPLTKDEISTIREGIFVDYSECISYFLINGKFSNQIHKEIV